MLARYVPTKVVQKFEIFFQSFRSSHQRCSIIKGVPKHFAKFTGKNLCQILFFNKVADPGNLIKKEALAQVFSGEFCEIFKNTFVTEHFWWLLLIFALHSTKYGYTPSKVDEVIFGKTVGQSPLTLLWNGVIHIGFLVIIVFIFFYILLWTI